MAEVSQEVKEEEQQEGAEATEAVGEEGAQSSPKFSKKKKMLAIAAVVIVALGGGGTVLYLKKHKETEEHAKQEEEASKNAAIFHDMDEMIVNLNTEGKSVSFMKLKITLEMEGKSNLESVQKFMPKINDVFQMYLRELRPADVQGSVGLYRLKEELLLRINKIVYPAQVNDLLFKEVLVQ